jgi:hypothetical protein
MYGTLHTDGKTNGRINYTVWSDVFTCPRCAGEVVFWRAAVDKEAGQVREDFPCPHCSAELTKRSMERAWVTTLDSAIQQPVRHAKRVPVLINYSVGKQRFEKQPDSSDLALIDKTENILISYWFPTDRMMEGGETRRNDPIGITHVHHFFTRRSLAVFSSLYHKLRSPLARLALLGGYTVGLRTARFLPLRWIQKDTGPMKPHTAGTLYVPSLSGEQNWLNIFQSRVLASKRGIAITHRSNGDLLATGSATDARVHENQVDYIFLDPPFGANLMYSELNFLGLFRLVWVGGVGTRPPGPQVQTRFVGNQAASASHSPAPRSGATDGPASKTGDRGAAVRLRFLFLLPVFVGRRAGGTP